MHPMTSAEIDGLFDVLVETCGAAPETRYAFVQSLERQLATAAAGLSEPRHLPVRRLPGLGGKVVVDDDRITVTSIDDNPQAHAVIKRANASLARLYASLGAPTPAIDRYPNGNVRFERVPSPRGDAWRLDLLSTRTARSCARAAFRSRSPGGHVDDLRAGRERGEGRPSSATRRTDALRRALVCPITQGAACRRMHRSVAVDLRRGCPIGHAGIHVGPSSATRGRARLRARGAAEALVAVRV